jgi:WD40 repeat protein
VVSAGDGGLVGWDAETGQQLWERPSHAVRSIRTSAAAYGHRGLCHLPLSNRVAYAVEPGVIAWVDYTTGLATETRLSFSESLNALDVSPDESLLACGCSEFLAVCDRQGVEKYRIANEPATPINQRGANDRLTFGGEFSYARFSPDGQRLAVVNSQHPRAIRILAADTGQELSTLETSGYVIRLCFSLDGKRIYTTEQTIAARAYDVAAGQLIWERLFAPPGQDERYTTDIAMSPSGKELAIGTAIGEDQTIHLVDPDNGATVGELVGHTWKPWCLAYRGDGLELYSAGWDSVVRRWDVVQRQQIRLENGERASGACTLSPDGRTVVFSDDTGKLHLIERATGKRVRGLQVPEVSFSQVIYSSDGQRLAAGGSNASDIQVYVWSTANGEVTHHWQWPKGRDVHSSVEALSFSADGNRLAACVFRQSACRVFDLTNQETLVKVRHPGVYGLCVSPDGETFASAGWDRKLRIWSCPTGELLREIAVGDAKSHDPRMYGVLYAPDGQTLAALRMDSTISVFSADLTPIRDIATENRVTYGSFCFSQQGRWLAVGQSDGKAAVHDVLTGELLWNEARHKKYVYNVAFSPDDRCLLTGGQDGVCYLWDLNVTGGQPVDYAMLGQDLIGASPRAAFAAQQRLLAEPEPAVGVLESLLNDLSPPTGEELSDVQTRTYERIIEVLSGLPTPLADPLLQQLQKSGPTLAIKRQAFTARRGRAVNSHRPE